MTVRLAVTLTLFAAVGCSSRPPMPCETNADCPAGCCRANAAGSLFCTNVCPCASDADCPASSLCLPDFEGDRVCMPLCPPTRESACFDGSFCHELTDGRRVCWPGGSTALGASCSLLLECQRTGLCVGLPGATTGTCVRACEVPAPGEGTVDPCPVGTMCMPTTEGNGFCPSR